MTKLVIVFRNFAHAPKNYTDEWLAQKNISKLDSLPEVLHRHVSSGRARLTERAVPMFYGRADLLQPTGGPHSSLRTYLRAALLYTCIEGGGG
jgi:hypothetical protein